jgi:hypothetical protein
MLHSRAGASICSHRSHLAVCGIHRRKQPLIKAACSTQQGAAPAALQRARALGSACSAATTLSTQVAANESPSGLSRRSSVVCHAAAAAMPIADGPSGTINDGQATSPKRQQVVQHVYCVMFSLQQLHQASQRSSNSDRATSQPQL